ncbi:LRR receptor-like serine/threonine-protein kinase isoform 2 [Hibiscus syriacus]|uniref:non-specific serine/threonine protein kinase n=1 Tax=Hibiscus syriacus TaxID=106335 RepID=A0A6A3CLH1_HIBSY|nr:LRR receptor-like serine/threonine-protein kinase isoform 2 [Hibiscus syriacus]
MKKQEPQGENDENFTVFSYRELRLATRGFSASNKIGEGAFGCVYKGFLANGSIVAVKMLSIELESFLVYNYMENNSLAQVESKTGSNLVGRQGKRFHSELLGGLAYLHDEVRPHIVHRDIKACNILLDQNLVPKVSDFGLSRVLRNDVSHISTHVAGTLGYLAPEYAFSGRLTRKTDVYSFGVLLLEVISGQTVVNFDLEHGEHYLVQKAWELYRANRILHLVDPILGMNYPKEDVVRFIKVGLLCVQETARFRPEMSTALKMLTNDVDMEGVQISQPGLVADLMNIKLGQKTTFRSLYSSNLESTPSSLSSCS